MPNLTPTERSALRARAHKLNPLVQIGDKGLTEPVLREVDAALNAHELIKVRADGIDRHAREELLHLICERLGAEPVQHIGRVLVLYRPKPEESVDSKPRRAPKQPRQPKRAYQSRG